MDESDVCVGNLGVVLKRKWWMKMTKMMANGGERGDRVVGWERVREWVKMEKTKENRKREKILFFISFSFHTYSKLLSFSMLRLYRFELNWYIHSKYINAKMNGFKTPWSIRGTNQTLGWIIKMTSNFKGVNYNLISSPNNYIW